MRTCENCGRETAEKTCNKCFFGDPYMGRRDGPTRDEEVEAEVEQAIDDMIQ